MVRPRSPRQPSVKPHLRGWIKDEPLTIRIVGCKLFGGIGNAQAVRSRLIASGIGFKNDRHVKAICGKWSAAEDRFVIGSFISVLWSLRSESARFQWAEALSNRRDENVFDNVAVPGTASLGRNNKKDGRPQRRVGSYNLFGGLQNGRPASYYRIGC